MVNKILMILNAINSKIQRVHFAVKRRMLYVRLARIGNNVFIHHSCTVFWPEKVTLGDNVFIEEGAHLSCSEGLEIKGDFMAGAYLTIIGGDHDFSIGDGSSMFSRHKGVDLPVVIEKDVWVGANVTILKGVHIAQGCVIAAGAVLTKNTEPYGIYGGVPAVLIKYRT